MEIQSVEVRFKGEELSTYTFSESTYTLYRIPEGLYCIHTDEEEIAFLDSGFDGEGLTEAQVRQFWPELAEAAGL